MFTAPFTVESAEHQHESPIFEQPEIKKTNVKSQLQQLIDDTAPGGTLVLEGQVYRGSMAITKPITIKGVAGTEIHSLATAMTITETENVVFENLVFEAEEMAIRVNNVKGLTLNNIQIEQSFAGIQLINSANILLQKVNIIGSAGHFSKKGHAVAVYESTNFTAVDSDIDQMMDGFYLESVNDITLQNNRVKNSRYAMHMMYSNDILLKNNTLEKNMTGFMVMIAKNVQIEQNEVAKNNTLNSLGVYTYDIDGLNFSGNIIRENTIAMDVQNARQMVIEHNLFSTNGTVLQVKRSSSLRVQHNEFHGNILTVRTDKDGIQLQRNYYDDYDGKDYDGDGVGDTDYIATNSFGQWMVQKPVYQYFMESPSVVTLNMMDTDVTGNHELVLVDEAPIVAKKAVDVQVELHVWQLVGSILVLLSVFIVKGRWT